MKSRITLVFIGFALLWSLILARAVYLQILPNERLTQLQKRQFETTVTLQSRRGAIYDRGGQELAVSLRSFSLFADPKLVEQPRTSALKLAKILGQPWEPLYRRLKQGKEKEKRFLWLSRNLDSDTKDQIHALKLTGIGFIQESKRVYPNRSLAAHVLGFVGQDGQGLEGVEARYDDDLRNRRKQISLPRDARGRPLVINGQYFAENLDGADIELTLDRELQFVLERELAQGVRDHQAEGALGIIMDVKSSEVLAMAQVPSFDPNQPGASAPEVRRNRAVTDLYEPGSVIKPLVVAGALAAGKVQANTKIDCEGGTLKVGGRIIHEAEAHEKFHWLSVSEILAFSSNVGITKLAFSYGSEGVRHILNNFGFGQRTGLNLLGEAKGVLNPLPWKPHQLANISFGQAMSATALQVANAYVAVANGGVLKTPLLVRSIHNLETGETRRYQSMPIRRVLPVAEAQRLTLMLTAATARGATGFKARVPGYPVAGKTGTAQKVRPDGLGYLKGAYFSSFAGMVPANDPQFVILVVLDNPQKNPYAAASAAPIFSRVASFALRKAMIPPVFISESNLLTAAPTPQPAQAPEQSAAQDPEHTTVPNLIGMSLREALRRSHESALEVKTVGEGWVVRTLPAPNEEMPRDKKLMVFLKVED